MRDPALFRLIPWLIGGSMILMLAARLVMAARKSKRDDGMKLFAASQGLAYARQDVPWSRVDLGWPHGEGSRHRARNLMTGTRNGHHVVAFDHVWVTRNGKTSTSHTARVTALQLPSRLPRVTVERESSTGRVLRSLGIADIELESDAFNRAYRVAGDQRTAYEVLTPRFMQWMLDGGLPGFTINEGYIAHAENGEHAPALLDTDVAYLSAVIDHIDDRVLRG